MHIVFRRAAKQRKKRGSALQLITRTLVRPHVRCLVARSAMAQTLAVRGLAAQRLAALKQGTPHLPCAHRKSRAVLSNDRRTRIKSSLLILSSAEISRLVTLGCTEGFLLSAGWADACAAYSNWYQLALKAGTDYTVWASMCAVPSGGSVAVRMKIRDDRIVKGRQNGLRLR